MAKKIIKITESQLRNVIKETINNVFNGSISEYDDIFDLRKIPKEILKKNFVSYSPYRLNASCDSRFQIGKNGKFVCEAIDYEGNVDDAIEDITSTFPIDKVYQVTKAKGHHGMYVALLVANKTGNLEIIIECMTQYNLFPSKEIKNNVLSDGETEWVDIRFEPTEQDDVTDFVRNNYEKLWHLSPEINEANILKTGLIASNNNPIYKYSSPRLHLIEGNATPKDIQNLANALYGQAQAKGIEGLSNRYTLFSIDLSKVPQTTRFFFDVNEKFGLFTNSNIEPSAISIEGYYIAK